MELKIISPKYGEQIVLIDDEDYEKVKNISIYLWSTERHRSLYAIMQIKRHNSIRLHRFILNAQPGQIVDHINGNALDNRKANLRITNYLGNNHNARKRKDGLTSKYKGVTKAGTKWIAQIQFNKKKMGLGTFSTEIEAAKAYNTAATHYFGEYAFLNIIVEDDKKAA